MIPKLIGKLYIYLIIMTYYIDKKQKSNKCNNLLCKLLVYFITLELLLFYIINFFN